MEKDGELYSMKTIFSAHLAVRVFPERSLYAYNVTSHTKSYKRKNPNKVPDNSQIEKEAYDDVNLFMGVTFTFSMIGCVIGVLYAYNILK